MGPDTTLSESVSFPVLAAETAGATVSVTAGATVATWHNKCESTCHHKIPNLFVKDVNLPLNFPLGGQTNSSPKLKKRHPF